DAAPFYPAGWFWIGGRFADLVGVPAWEFYKPFAIFTMALAASFAFLAWRALAGSRIAVPLALSTAAVGLVLAAYEPYSWLFIALLPAVAVWAQRIAEPRYLAYTGVFLGLAAITYTLIAAIGVVIVTAGSAIYFARTPRDGRGTRLRVVGSWVAAGIVSALIALLFWTPYLLAVLRGDGHERSVATDFAPEDAAQWPLPMLSGTGLVLMSIAGLVWLAWTVGGAVRGRGEGAGASSPEIVRIAFALAIMVLAGYAWFALSGLRAITGSTLLPFRLTPVITLAFACAGVFALREAWRRARAWAEANDRGPQVAALAVALGAVFVVHAAQSVSEEDAEFSDKARSAPGEPTAVVEAISDVTGGAEPQDLVVLSDDTSLYMFHPYWAFQAPAAAYAAPTGEYEKRNGLIEGWSKATSGRELAGALHGGEFPGPDVLVLTPEKGSDGEVWTYDEVVNTMPLKGNIRQVPIEFDPEIFADESMFHVEHAGGRVVIGVR
ncbi:MAG TPA: galactan 5-O-arabinofuranosyltransferase, partial [Dietzia timorensis]